MENRLWHSSYPAGLPHDIALDESETLVTLLERAFTRHAARTAVTCAGESLTFAQVEHASALLARSLQAAGLKRGDRVALLLAALPHFSARYDIDGPWEPVGRRSPKPMGSLKHRPAILRKELRPNTGDGATGAAPRVGGAG